MLVFLLAVCFSAAVCSLYILPTDTLLYCGSLLVLALFLLWLIFRCHNLLLGVFVVAGLCFGLWRSELSFRTNEYQALLGTNINVEGYVVQNSPKVERNQQVTVRPDGFKQDLRASLYLPSNTQKGDRVWFRGQVELPENFEGFDYVGFLQRQNVYAVLKRPQIIVLHQASGLNELFARLRDFVIERSKYSFSPKAGALITGMLIGERGTIPEDLETAFRQTGMTHIVAVSGYNMTIVATFCAVSAWYIGRKASGLVTAVVIVSFSVLAGGSASVVRSAVMALLLVLAQFTGRLYTSSYALVWAAGLMVIHNPKIIIWDVGFQLSVLATLGVLYAYRLRKIENFESQTLDILRPTAGAIITTAPLIAFHFGTVSLISPLANILLLPLVPFIMLFGALSFVPVTGKLFVLPANLLAELLVKSIEKFSALPWSSIQYKISASALILCYLTVFCAVTLLLKSRKKRELFNLKKNAKIKQ